MSVFIVTRKSDSVEVYRYEHTVALDLQLFPFATHNHTVYVAPPAPEPPFVPVRITRPTFRQRLTVAERIALEVAAIDDASATGEARAQAAALRVYLQDIAGDGYLDLADTDTRNGVFDLEAIGLIAPGRALVILDTPPTEEEVWNG